MISLDCITPCLISHKCSNHIIINLCINKRLVVVLSFILKHSARTRIEEYQVMVQSMEHMLFYGPN